MFGLGHRPEQEPSQPPMPEPAKPDMGMHPEGTAPDHPEPPKGPELTDHANLPKSPLTPGALPPKPEVGMGIGTPPPPPGGHTELPKTPVMNVPTAAPKPPAPPMMPPKPVAPTPPAAGEPPKLPPLPSTPAGPGLHTEAPKASTPPPGEHTAPPTVIPVTHEKPEGTPIHPLITPDKGPGTNPEKIDDSMLRELGEAIKTLEPLRNDWPKYQEALDRIMEIQAKLKSPHGSPEMGQTAGH